MSQAGIAGMRRAAQDIFDVVETFDDADWQAPSAASGWSTKDVVTHVGLCSKISSQRSTNNPCPTWASNRSTTSKSPNAGTFPVRKPSRSSKSSSAAPWPLSNRCKPNPWHRTRRRCSTWGPIPCIP